MSRMLVVRDVQLRSLADTAEQSFELRLVEHLRRYFPASVGSLDSWSVGAVGPAANARAGHYGLVSERDICKFLNLPGTFGDGFESSANHGWMASYLADPDVQGPTGRMRRVCAAVLRRLDRRAAW